MNRIVEHIPAFVDRAEPPRVAEFDSVADLLAIPWVRRQRWHWRFYRFSQDGTTLIAEYKRGREWWVIGYMDRPTGLPIWKEKA